MIAWSYQHSPLLEWVPIMVQQILPVVLPTFFMVLIGFLWSRSGQDYPTVFVGKIVTFVGVPFLVFSTLAMADISSQHLEAMLLASVLLHVGGGIIGAIIFWSLNMPIRTYLCPFVIGNGGNLGLSVCLFAYGGEGLAYGISFFVVQSMMFFTIGNAIYTGQNSLRSVVSLPLPYAGVAGITVVLLGIELPQAIANSVSLAGSFVIPMMLMTLGVSLARMRPSDIMPALGFAILRLVVFLTLAHLICDFLEIDGVMRGVLLLQASMPVAVFNFVFATTYNRSPERVAGIVFVSSVMMILGLPLMVAYVGV